MLTFRKGAAGTPKVARAMAEYLASEPDTLGLSAHLASYYGEGMAPDGNTSAAAIPRQDMHPSIATLLGIDPARCLTAAEAANILTGQRTDGADIPGKRLHRSTENKVRIAYIDLTFSSPKSLSIGLALAPTEREAAILERIHRAANDKIMRVIAQDLGWARKGDGGKDGADPGHITWITYDHYAARPTVQIGRTENGIATTELVAVKVAGDPLRHSHNIVPNIVITDDGRVTALDLSLIKTRTHEYGALFQAFVVADAKRHGIRTELHPETWMAHFSDVPARAVDLFSKRSQGGEDTARAVAAERGVDWDSLDADARVRFLKYGNRKTRLTKDDDEGGDKATWLRQAAEARYQHRSLLRPDEIEPPLSQADRQRLAYEASLPYLDGLLGHRSKLDGSEVRTAAAKGLIATGAEGVADVNAITAAHRTEGITQGGVPTAITWGYDKKGDERRATVTTVLHVDQEERAIAILRNAAADHSTDLTPAQIEAAVQRVSARHGYDFTTEHGQRQRAMIDRLATAGRVAVGIGLPGAGKSALLAVPIDAWREDGRNVYGVTLAWRQSGALADAGVGKKRKGPRLVADTDSLTDAGIDNRHAMALAQFLRHPPADLDRRTVVVVDEISQIGTRQILELALLQEKHGFQIVGTGDPWQGQSVEAGSTVRLFQKALGEKNIPELLETVRQALERDRKTALMFRAGQSAKALARMAEDKALRIVPGGYTDAVHATVDLREERGRLYPEPHAVGISAPANADARAIGAEIRRRRQARGEMPADSMTVPAIDGTETAYDLHLAIGDRLRLFRKITAPFEGGGHGRFAENGKLVDVLELTADGIRLRNDKGRIATLAWDRLRDPKTGRIQITYGAAQTIDARQGDTLLEHIWAMPAGTETVNRFKAASAGSRHRLKSWLVTSQGAELMEVVGRRALGDPRNAETDPDKVNTAIMANMARNLAADTSKGLATDFIDRADGLRTGTINARQATWHRTETPAPPAEQPAVVRQIRTRWRNPDAVAAEMARRAAPTPTPRRQKARPAMSEAEAQAEFAARLEAIGLRLSGPPIMDGQRHYVATEGARREKRGTYLGYRDGQGGWGYNNKTGEQVRWTAQTARTQTNSPAAAAAERQRIAAERAMRESERRQAEELGALQAAAIWQSASPATRHPYLTAKDVPAVGVRIAAPGQSAAMGEGQTINIAGRLLVPMRDATGRLWNAQMIDAKGGKFYLPGRKTGLFTDLGEPVASDEPRIIAEGYATAAALYASTSLSTRVAFDATNLVPVAAATRAAEPLRTIVFAADNDHHLPGVRHNLAADKTGQINLTWPAGATGRARQGDTVEYRLAGDTAWSEAVRGTVTNQIALTGLMPGARYEVRIYAEHRGGPLPNAGVEKATAAATARDKVLVPPFAAGNPGTDWNDYARQLGRAAVRAAFEREGVRMPTKPEDPQLPSQAVRDAAKAARTPKPADVTATAQRSMRATQQPAPGLRA